MTLFGIINVNKPAGCTSRDVVDRVVRIFPTAKAGHAGTLDPLAIGVLVICVGRATRLIKYVQQMQKLYESTFLLGHQSETDDIEGQVTILDNTSPPTRAAIERALPQFLGTIQQRPPAYSALKIAGRRAYQLARQGSEVVLASRSITVYGLRILHYAYPELQLEIQCSSGTYVRALGRDLAAALGTTAVMSKLTRTAVGSFRIENAVPPGDLAAETASLHLQTPLAALPDLEQVVLSDAEIVEIRHGRPIDSVRNLSLPELEASQSEWAAVDAAGQLVAILKQKLPNQLWPAMNFQLPARP